MNSTKEMITKKPADFYNRSNGNRIECEGERQKSPKYINVFRGFRFLSPTKLNRDEQARYSEAHPIQPLCLGGSRDLSRTSRLKLRRCKTKACTGAL